MEPTSSEIIRIFNGDKNYIVPHFQRQYVWDKDKQWLPLWEDLQDLLECLLAKEVVIPHFMGSVVLKQEGSEGSIDKRIIIDGQQRFVTLHIIYISLVRALSNIINSINDGEARDKIKRVIDDLERNIINKNLSGDEKYKIHPFGNDFKVLANIVENKIPSNEKTTHKLILCHNFFMKKITSYLEYNMNQIVEIAENLQKILYNYIFFCRIDLSKSEDQYIIFETLNDRGQPLSEWDKAKNLLISNTQKAGKSEENFYEDFIEIFDNDLWWKNEIDRFFSFWIKIYLIDRVSNIIPDNRTYTYFRKHLNLEDPCIIADSLKEYSQIYNKIVTQPEDSTTLGLFMQRLNALGNTVIIPLIMKLQKELEQDNSQFKFCITAIESYIIRRLICGNNTKGYNQTVLSLLQNIHNTNYDNFANELINNLGSRSASDYWPNDDRVRSAIKNRSVYGSGRIARSKLTMILIDIDRHITSSKAGGQPNYNNLQIEHIMPQKWQQNYSLNNLSEAEVGEMIDRLGNLTIVTSKFNSSLSNDPWQKKRQQFIDNDNLFINKELSKFTHWNQQSIDIRGNQLADAICEIWPHVDALNMQMGQ